MKFLSILICFVLCQFSLFAHRQAIKRLLEGNQRFIEGKGPECFSNQSKRRQALIDNQKPFAVILGCSDSRVPPEILFDQGIGDLFIIRVAGNVLGPSEIDSITYATSVLGSPLIVVLGHENCGAVQAVMDGKADSIPYINKEILPALDLDDPLCSLGCQVKKNVKYIVDVLKKTPRFAKAVKEDKLRIVGAFYPFVSGKVEFLD